MKMPCCSIVANEWDECAACGCDLGAHSVNHPHHCLGLRETIHDRSACKTKCRGFKAVDAGPPKLSGGAEDAAEKRRD